MSAQSVELPLARLCERSDDLVMSDISFEWQDLASIPSRLTDLDGELRALYPLLDSAGPAMQASAATVAVNINELAASLRTSLDRSLASITHDIEGVREAMRAYNVVEDTTKRASEQMCRKLPSAANASR
jgi:hypothetical protein